MEFIKKHWLTIVLLIVVYIFFELWNDSRHSSNLLRDKIEVMNDSIRTTIDENGNLEAEKRGLEVTLSDLKSENEILGIDKKKLKKEVGNLSNLVAFYKVRAQTSGSVKTEAKDTVIVYKDKNGVDSVRQEAVSFDWNNNWLNISGLYVPVTKTVTLDYGYQLNYNLYSYKKRYPKWKVWKPKELYVKVEFEDPSIKVSQLDYVKVADRPKFYERGIFKYGAGFLAGYLLFKL